MTNPTLAGIAAIIMWSLLAFMTAASGASPPFQLLAMTFAIGTLVGFAGWMVKRPNWSRLNLPPLAWLIGIGGLFGYHFFYYTALRNAPIAEASLIAYLWPLLIVLFSALLPGGRLKAIHLIGAACGFTGASLLILGNNSNAHALDGNVTGYGSALLCAFIWSGYSVASRAFKQVPTDAVVIFCLATAILSALCHLALEETIWPADLKQWLAVIGLGVMPVGLAFYAWDHAMKHGPIQLLGSMAYFAPVLSTLVLIASGIATPNWQLLAATIFVTLGAIIASGKLTKAST